eukprot:Gregarina_sp_Pseudo_9__444@NODE_1288_length_1714_cov_6_752239_g1211_i0_p2_GENE_NODE_1288_length_1714_cov_6_752239_g1211_i0NODE_1288_length_1714_cov_6_752239_g1211_i0_p2_ORF_typecomplete_len229_score42_07CGI121/PF08617_10/1_8e09_NODE_1288_length_1714_cov_6_752239_g1211_i010271656
MKLVDLSPEYPDLKVCYFEYNVIRQQAQQIPLDHWAAFLKEVSFLNDIDISQPATDATSRLQDSPLPLIFDFKKVVSWRVLQAALLSALDSVLTGNKKVKTFKADVLYRLAPGWSVKNIRAQLEPTFQDSLLVVWICDAKTEAHTLHAELQRVADKHAILLSREERSNFEYDPQNAEALKSIYGVTDKEIALTGGLELAILQKSAVKDI